jgi:2-aminoadipate transaminase
MNRSPDAPFEPRWARRIAHDQSPPFGAERAPLSLAFGLPDPALFPAAELAAATARVMEDPARATAALQYGNTHGQTPMLALLAEKLTHDEGLNVTPDNLLITSGSSAAIAVAARSLIDEGDIVLVEAPSFAGVMSILRRTGAQLCMVPMGPDGIDIAATETLLDSMHARGQIPRVLYTMPTFHNPVGCTLPEDQRGALLALARRYSFMIIEDDAYRDLYYDMDTGPLPSSLYALDREGRAIRTGTFSKILAPGMRLGWAISQPETIGKMMLLKDEGGTNPFAQQVAVEYGKDGVLMAHIATLVDAYRAKRGVMLSAMEQYFPPEASWTRPAGGFFVWVTLPSSVDPAQLATLAREEGVNYMPGERCFAGPPPVEGTHLRLSFSNLKPDDIEEAVKRLGRAVRSLM